MRHSITYWGWVGVGIALLLSLAALCASPTPIHEQVGTLWYVTTYPVAKAWEAFFRTQEGDRAMMFILPMLATQLLFVLLLGFAVGALLGRAFGRRRASANRDPRGSFGDPAARGGPPSVS